VSEELDQPQLNCPSCGQSLRGLEPLPPALLLRCPECGTVTSITQLAADFTQRQKDIRRLPLLVLQSLIIAAVVLAVAELLDSVQLLQDPSVLGFAFLLGAGISGWFTVPWRDAPASARFIAIIGGGVVEVIATMFLGLRLGCLPMLAWCWIVHLHAKQRGFA